LTKSNPPAFGVAPLRSNAGKLCFSMGLLNRPNECIGSGVVSHGNL